MQIRTHQLTGKTIAEIVAEGIIIQTAEEGVNLVGELYFSGFDQAIIHSKQLTPAFFDLSTGIAGEVLQKFSTYRIRLAIIIDPEMKQSKALEDFIRESNKTGHINFVGSVEDAFIALVGVITNKG